MILMSSKVTDVLDGLFGSKTLHIIYFWKPLVTPTRKARRILMSSKVTDVLNGLFGLKTLCIIYFWKPLVKYNSMMLTLVIFDSNQDS